MDLVVPHKNQILKFLFQRLYNDSENNQNIYLDEYIHTSNIYSIYIQESLFLYD